MGGTRIIVLQMREIIKFAVLALVGLCLLIVLICLFIPKHKSPGEQSALFVPGTYSADIILHNKVVNVEVTVTDKDIVTIELVNLNDSLESFYPLFKPTMDSLSAQIIKKQSTALTSTPDNQETVKVLLSAINKALVKADANAQATVY